jgi:hydroxyethylthiazole kinase
MEQVQPLTTPEGVFAALEKVRGRRPLVHNITNYVAMTVSANVLLALGASPAMVHAIEEVEDFLTISDALAVNIGTLSPEWVTAMHRAAARAKALGKPWVLDPVGCGATPYRTQTSAALAALAPTIIRANAGEVLSLFGATGAVKGVDSSARSQDTLAAIVALARQSGAVVAVTGDVDYVTDGARVLAVESGDAMMPLSTALGCSLSAVTAAFATVAPPLQAAQAALAVFGAAGAEAAERCRGPGHLPAEICDALYRMDAGTLGRRVRLAEKTAPTA